MPSELDLFHDLSFYTLAHEDRAFIHQNAVDAFTAQQADVNTKPIAVVFALVGLYLHVEKQFTGRQVQKAHMRLANRRKSWPTLVLPKQRGDVRVSDVIAKPPGPSRDAMIHHWCDSVWQAFAGTHTQIAQLLAAELGIT
jgi:hypothetical protein